MASRSLDQAVLASTQGPDARCGDCGHRNEAHEVAPPRVCTIERCTCLRFEQPPARKRSSRVVELARLDGVQGSLGDIDATVAGE